jgi:PrcB C-terminal
MKILQVAAKAAPYLLVLSLMASLDAQIAFTTVLKGDASGQQTQRQVVVRTPAEWQALWKAHALDPSAKLPSVDFGTKMVVGVFLGSKPSAGYDVEIVAVRTQEKELLVEYVQTEPGRGTMAAQILTEPFHLVAVNKHAGDVRFVHGPVTRK